MRIVLALLLLTTTAHAGNNELALGPSTRILRTSSANAVTADSLAGGTLAYARASGIALVPGLDLWATAAFGWGAADGMMFQTLTTELDTLAFTLGGRARYAWHPRIVASARLDLGTARTALALRDGQGHTADDAGWGATTSAAVGLDLYAVRGSRFALGIRLELGAVATSSIPLTATPASGSEGTLTLEMTAASLGELNLSGTMFAVSAVSQF
jgi:hypothetical protein